MSCHSMPVRKHGYLVAGFILAALLLIGGCRDRDPVGPGDPDPVLPGLAIISNPATPVAPTTGQSAALVAPAVYVSMPSGTFASGIGVSIRNIRTGSTVTAGMIAGGLDPVAVGATVDDSLEFTITLIGGSPIRFVRKVPARKPPVIVRTDPPPGKRDVPLNAIIVVVFSEPVDSATVSTTSIKLTRIGVNVSGQVTLAADGLSATFQPDAPLLSMADYILTVTTAVADRDGDALEAPVTLGFVAQNEVTSAARIYERVTPHSVPGYHSRYLLRDDGAFELQYETITWGNFAYTGQYSLTDSMITFDFDGSNTAGPWEATGTLLSNSLVVEYNLVMQLADFENGVYVHTPQPLPPGVLAFTGVLGHIDLMTPDGTFFTRLTADTFFNAQAAWSPDGSRIAFSRLSGSYSAEIHVMNADGTNLVRISPAGATDAQPSWSPDGNRIAFQHQPGTATGDIYVMNADGTNRVRLTNSVRPSLFPAWSPAGDKIAFMTISDSANSAIYVMDADGTNPVALTDDSALVTEPAWSPDGSKIVFQMLVGTGSDLFSMHADGTNLARLTTNLTAAEPTWSPDGLFIAFIMIGDCEPPRGCVGPSLWTVRTTDGFASKMAQPEGVGFDPSWRP